MGVRVQLEHHVATVNFNRDQFSVRRDTLGLTQQEDHRYAMTHFQDGFFLTRNIDRRREMGTLGVFIFRVGTKNKMVRWYTDQRQHTGPETWDRTCRQQNRAHGYRQ